MTKLAYALIGGFLAAITLLAVGFYLGHMDEKLEWQTSEAQIKASGEARVAAVSAYATGLSADLEIAKSHAASGLSENLQEIPNATSTFTASPLAAPQPLPDYRFTVAAVCLWDAANALPVPGAPLRPDGTPDCTHVPDASGLTDITPADALTNEQYNGAAHAVCRAELTKLQAFVTEAEKQTP